MSHTTDLGDGWIAHHNGDFSGNVTLRRPDAPEHQFRIPFDCLLLLVAEAVRSKRVAELEDADPRQILGLDEL